MYSWVVYCQFGSYWKRDLLFARGLSNCYHSLFYQSLQRRYSSCLYAFLWTLFEEQHDAWQLIQYQKSAWSSWLVSSSSCRTVEALSCDLPLRWDLWIWCSPLASTFSWLQLTPHQCHYFPVLALSVPCPFLNCSNCALPSGCRRLGHLLLSPPLQHHYPLWTLSMVS